MPNSRVLRGEYARTVRTLKATGSPDVAERATRLRRDYYAEALAEHIEATLAKAPPLTDEQRARLARLLTGAPS